MSPAGTAPSRRIDPLAILLVGRAGRSRSRACPGARRRRSRGRRRRGSSPGPSSSRPRVGAAGEVRRGLQDRPADRREERHAHAEPAREDQRHAAGQQARRRSASVRAPDLRAPTRGRSTSSPTACPARGPSARTAARSRPRRPGRTRARRPCRPGRPRRRRRRRTRRAPPRRRATSPALAALAPRARPPAAPRTTRSIPARSRTRATAPNPASCSSASTPSAWPWPCSIARKSTGARDEPADHVQPVRRPRTARRAARSAPRRASAAAPAST